MKKMNWSAWRVFHVVCCGRQALRQDFNLNSALLPGLAGLDGGQQNPLNQDYDTEGQTDAGTQRDQENKGKQELNYQ